MKKNGQPFENLTGTPSERAKKYRGLGDVVAVVAKPAAKIIDKVAHTNLQNCLGCEARQNDWNKKFPL